MFTLRIILHCHKFQNAIGPFIRRGYFSCASCCLPHLLLEEALSPSLTAAHLEFAVRTSCHQPSGVSGRGDGSMMVVANAIVEKLSVVIAMGSPTEFPPPCPFQPQLPMRGAAAMATSIQ